MAHWELPHSRAFDVISPQEMIALAQDVKAILAREPTVFEMPAPCKVSESYRYPVYVRVCAHERKEEREDMRKEACVDSTPLFSMHEIFHASVLSLSFSPQTSFFTLLCSFSHFDISFPSPVSYIVV